MELINQIDVPVFNESVMAIYLQLVRLTIVVTMNHWSGMVYIFSVFMPNIFHKNGGCILLICDFVDILNETGI